MNLHGRVTSIILMVSILAIIILLLATANHNVEDNLDNLDEDFFETNSEIKNDMENTLENSNDTDNETKEVDKEGEVAQQNEQEVQVSKPVDREKSKEYNAQGYDLYLGGEYEEALKMFEKSIYYDDNYFYGHYNYACTLGVLMKQDYEKWYSYKEDIIMHLWRVQEINPEYIHRIKTDSDLDLIRKEFDYYLLLGLSPNETNDVKEILHNLSWYIQGQGAYSILGGAEFNSDNTFNLWYYDFSNNFEKLEFKGKYEVVNNKITLSLNNRMLRRKDIADIFDNYSEYEEKIIFYGELTEDGSIEIDIFQYPLTYWYDEFSA